MHNKSFLFLLSTFLLLPAGCAPPENVQTPRFHVVYAPNEANAGDAPVDNNQYEAGELVVAQVNSGNLTKSGRSLLSWNAESSGLGVSYPLGSTFAMGSQNLTLYAHWVGAKLFFDPDTTSVDKDTTVTLTPVVSGGTQWKWYVDNVLVPNENTSSFVFTASTVGHHLVTALATVAGVGYSGTCVVIVNQ